MFFLRRSFRDFLFWREQDLSFYGSTSQRCRASFLSSTQPFCSFMPALISLLQKLYRVKDAILKVNRLRLYDLPVDFWKWYEFLCLVVFFLFLFHLPPHDVQPPGAPVSGWRMSIQCGAPERMDHLHPGANSLTEILMWQDSHPHHQHICRNS